MRRLVVAMLALAVTGLLAGCGGGDAATTSTVATSTAPAAVATATAPTGIGGTAAIADRSESSAELFQPFKVDAKLPAAVAERLKSRQPMLLLFYSSEQRVTDDLRDEVDAVIDENQGNIDLITYDLSKHASIDTSGEITVDDSKLAEDTAGQQSVSFARAAGVDHLPYILIIDDQGYEIFWSRGFVDRDLLGRQIERATR